MIENKMNYITIILTLITGVIAFVVTFVQYGISKRNNEKELELKNNIKKISTVPQENEESSKKDKNIGYENNYLYNLLEVHHNQALKQANIQFWLSIIVAVLGFVIMIIIMFVNQGEKWYDNLIKTIPGTIIEVISVLFITQARETRDKATNFFKELNYDKKVEKSIEIADSIEDMEIKSSVKSKIALHIIGINEDKQI